jgi:hypothetical protein
VFIGGLPAARVTDLATCTGGPDAIAAGAFTVLINGLPAARMGDLTVHGGTIGSGQPTVLIGDGSPGVSTVRRGNMFLIVDREAKTITISGIQEFSGYADATLVDRATKSINAVWSGPTTFEGHVYSVTSMVQGRILGAGGVANPLANQVVVSHTMLSPTQSREQDPANVGARNVTYIHNNEDEDGGLTIPHEFGHTMGLNDEYREGPRNPDGTRSIVRTGPKGGLMGDVSPGSRPTDANHADLINGTGLRPM